MARKWIIGFVTFGVSFLALLSILNVNSFGGRLFILLVAAGLGFWAFSLANKNSVKVENDKPNYPPPPKWSTGGPTSHGSATWDNANAIPDDFNEGVNQFDGEGYYIGGDFRLSPLVHGVTIAGSGQGKGVCLILPNLLSRPTCSWFVLDPKGENALISARWQQHCGQDVVLLDPWNEQKRLGAIHGIEPVGFNPLAFVKGNPDEMPESCGVLADMIVPDTGAKDSYWESRARSLIKTYLLHLITFCPSKDQHLGTLYRWLRLPISERQKLWLEMHNNLKCDELVKSGIGEFLGMNEDSGPLPSIISTAQNNTTFLESVPLRASLENNEFDPYSLTNGQTTVYLCLPERFIDTHARWLRLVVGVCLKACNYKPKERVNFLLDEFAILGRMRDVERAYAFARGQNVSMWIFVQSLTQLIEIYGEHGGSAFLSNARLRQFFGVYDLYTQKYLSEYLGEQTVTSFSKNTSTSLGGSSGSSSGSSSGWSAGGSNTGANDGTSSGINWSRSTTTNEQPTARRLLTVEEVGKAEPIITFIDSRKYQIVRQPFWQDPLLAHTEGKAIFIPRNEQDWRDFQDELHGRKPQRWSPAQEYSFRADGERVKINNAKKQAN